MKITKFGHCCLLIETKGLRILTDPGAWSVETGQNSVKNIDLVLLTHEHPDHYHVDSLRQILKNNKDASIITNAAVGRLLNEEQLSYELIAHKEQKTTQGITIEAHESPHAKIYKTVPDVLNTGFFIDDTLFYPGDAFIKPAQRIRTLALPVAGPWMKLSEAIDYALSLKPEKCFPVHDGMLKFLGSTHRLPQETLQQANIEFLVPELGKQFDVTA